MQELEWHFSKLGNCSGIFQNRMNWSGIYPINPFLNALASYL
jgi:hypothetical protein